MPIDPRLYQKYSGKMPGEAMTRYGQSLAKQSARGPAGDTSFLGAVGRGRFYTRIGLAVLALVIVVALLFGNKFF